MPGSTEGPQGHPQTRSIPVCMHGLARCARRSWCSVRSATPGPCRRCRQCTCADTGIHTGPQPASTSPWANISTQLPRSPHTTRTARYRGGHGSIRPNCHLRPTWPARAGAVAMARRAPGHPHARTSPPSLNWAGCLFRRGWMRAFPHWPWQCGMEASWTNCATVRVILFCISYYCDSH